MPRSTTLCFIFSLTLSFLGAGYPLWAQTAAPPVTKKVSGVLALVPTLLKEAMVTADGLNNLSEKSRALTAIGEARSKAGNISGGKQSLLAAQGVAMSVADKPEKVALLAEVGSAYRRIDHVAEADTVCTLAEQIAGQIFNDKETNPGLAALAAVDPLMNLSRLRMKSGDAAGAAHTKSEATRIVASAIEAMNSINAAESPSRSYDKACARAAIAQAQFPLGDVAGAKANADAIADDGNSMGYQKSIALAGLAGAQAESGDLAGGLQTALAVKGYWQRRALWHVAVAQAQNGQGDAARQTVKKNPDDFFVNLSLVGIAGHLAERGDLLGTQKACDGVTDPNLKPSALTSLVKVQARMRNITAASNTAQQITDINTRNEALCAVILVQAHTGDVIGAKDAAMQLVSPYWKVTALAGIVREIMAKPMK